MSQLKLGVVGTGFIADVMATAIRESGVATITAVASRRRERADAFAQGHDVERAFDHWSELMGWDGIDAVYVATPTVAREDVCLASARAGKHLLAEKPFANLHSLCAITAACRATGVAFIDATHFVHHPRHTKLRAQLVERVGQPQSIHTKFFFPCTDRANIRLDPQQEPTGAIGDMAWYSMRAVAEFTPDDAALDSASGFLQRDPVTHAVIRGAGVLRLSDGCTSTWEAGYNTGASVMDLSIQGSRGMIWMDDFVLDWQRGFEGGDPSRAPTFSQRSGVSGPANFESVTVASEVRQSALLVRAFASLVADPHQSANERSMQMSERTQALIDGIWSTLR